MGETLIPIKGCAMFRYHSQISNVSRTLLSGFFVLCLFRYGSAQRSLTLEDALEIAKANSPDIKQSELNLERGQQSLKAQRASLKSQFRLSLTPFSFTRERQFERFFSTWNTSDTKSSTGTFSISQPIQWTDGSIGVFNRFSWQDAFSEFTGDRNKSFSNNLYLSYEQPLFTYNRAKMDLKEVELDLENAYLSYSIQSLTLENSVATMFYDVYFRKLNYDIAVEEYQNQLTSYEIMKNKVDAGLAAMEELYQAELNLASSKSSVQNNQMIVANALDDFKNFIGMPLTEEIAVITDVSHEAVDVDLNKAIESALTNRQELRQRKIAIENARFELIRTAALNEFRGDFSFTYGIIGNNEKVEDVYEKPTKNQRVSVDLEIPLFDWGEKKARMKATEASLRSQELSFDVERNTIIIAIRKACRNLENLNTQIEIARQNVRNAELTYDINLERYRNGDLTSMDLNLFQTQLSEKKIGLVQALIDYRLALLNLKVQSLWDFRTNKPVLDIKY